MCCCLGAPMLHKDGQNSAQIPLPDYHIDHCHALLQCFHESLHFCCQSASKHHRDYSNIYNDRNCRHVNQYGD